MFLKKIHSQAFISKSGFSNNLNDFCEYIFEKKNDIFRCSGHVYASRPIPTTLPFNRKYKKFKILGWSTPCQLRPCKEASSRCCSLKKCKKNISKVQQKKDIFWAHSSCYFIIYIFFLITFLQ